MVIACYISHNMPFHLQGHWFRSILCESWQHAFSGVTMVSIALELLFQAATVRRRLLPALLGLAIAVPASAQTGTLTALQALGRAHAAVVGIQTTVAEDARSAESLGVSRSGSGVVIAPDGLILTIGYLTLEAEQVQITTREGIQVPGRVVAYDVPTGLSLVTPVLPLPKVQPVPLGDSRHLNPGDALLAAYAENENTDQAGMATARLIRRHPFSASWEYHLDAALFTSPPLSQHSGAPLFNQQGELLGIGSLKLLNAATESRPLPGNMFVPVDALVPVLDEMRRLGSSRQSHRPWLGLTSSEQNGRVQLVAINKAGPAKAAGLAVGDVILGVDGVKVTSLEMFYKQVWAHADFSQPLKLTVLQGADVNTVLIDAVDRLSTLRKPEGI